MVFKDANRWRATVGASERRSLLANQLITTFSTDRQTYSIHSGCFPCTTALSPPPEPQVSGSYQGKWLRLMFTPIKGGQGGDSLVDNPPRCKERQRHPESTSRSSDRDRCLQDGVGGGLSRGENRGSVVSNGAKAAHKLPRIELLAGSFAVKSFTKNRLCAHVRLRMHNTTAVVYVNRLGGTHSLVLSNLALALWEWAQKSKIMLSAKHYAGHLNTAADWESRHFLDSSNWRLDH